MEERGQTGIRRFIYNRRHQQIQVETETGKVQENRYDAEGLRYKLLENGRRTSFVYHNGELLHEKGGETGLSGEEKSYHLGVGIEAFQRKQKIFYYHQDEQLNTTLISDGDAKLRNQYQYDAFGVGLDALEELSNRIRYTGQQYDQLTGQYYLRARYYNPVFGRFIQEDVYQGDGLNLYAYCQNNPVIYYDSSGYSCYEKGWGTCTRHRGTWRRTSSRKSTRTAMTQEDTYRGDGLNLYAYCANNPVYYEDPSGHAPKCVKEAYDKIKKENPGISEEQAWKRACQDVQQTKYLENILEKPVWI